MSERQEEYGTALAVQKFGPSDIQLLKDQVCSELTDGELALFIKVAERTGLDPFARQIYAVKRMNNRLKRKVMSIQTAIDGYRVLADRTGRYAGNDEPTYGKAKNGKPESAQVTVWKLVDGTRYAFTATARWSEYAPTGSNAMMWNKMPFLMLGKCAEALALRKAFPAQLSGLYTDAEMDQANVIDSPEVKDVTPELEQIEEAEDTAENAWIMNDATRKAFWAETHELGLTHEEVHIACAVDSMKDYADTYNEALRACRAYVVTQMKAEQAEA